MALWADSKVVVFFAGTNAGFDQLASIDPATGTGDYILENLAESQLVFACDIPHKACDTWQTAAYDAVDNRIYFQASLVSSDDAHMETTVVVYTELAARHPSVYTALDPFTFGFLGFQYVTVTA